MNTISFSDIYTSYYKRSFLFVKSYVRDDMIAEDIVSEALIHLWETTRKETVEHPMSLLLAILGIFSKSYKISQLIHTKSIAN